MSQGLRDAMVAKLPTSAAKMIVLYPSPDNPGGLSALWYGLTDEQVAEALYQMADLVVDQRIPPPDWRERIK